MVNRNKPLSEKASDAVEEIKDQAQVRGRAVAEHLKQDQRADRTAQDIKDDLSKDKNEVRAEGALTSVQNVASQAWEATKETVSNAWEATKDMLGTNADTTTSTTTTTNRK